MHPNSLNPENAPEATEPAEAAAGTHTHADGSECGHDHSDAGHSHAGHGHAHAEPQPGLGHQGHSSEGEAFTSLSTVDIDDVVEAMRDVVDPELGINVVDLGLVYGIHVDENSNAVINMTLTSAACPLTDVIQDQTEMALEGLVADVAVNWVWMPPWGPDKITDDGREQLRALGFNV